MITFSVVEDQLTILDKGIQDRSTAIFKARNYHDDNIESWHEVYRHGEDGSWGIFQLKPNDNAMNGKPNIHRLGNKEEQP